MWKQYILVAILLALSLVIIAAISIPAVLPSVVKPPAVVPGGRVVLAHGALPAVAGEPMLVADRAVDAAPLVERVPLDDEHAFWLVRLGRDDYVAVRTVWSPSDGAPQCDVVPFDAGIFDLRQPVDRRPFFQACPRTQGWLFGLRGEPFGAPRSLRRYLVSVDGDRLIVNISREIREYGATPQPRVAPLSTP